MAKAERDGDFVKFRCPGCGWPHILRVDGQETPRWGWNGSLDKPTFTPSILARRGPDLKDVCHSFVCEGCIEFLSDCTHELAGRTVELEDIK